MQTDVEIPITNRILPHKLHKHAMVPMRMTVICAICGHYFVADCKT